MTIETNHQPLSKNSLLPKDIKPVFLTKKEVEEAKQTVIVYAADDPRKIVWTRDQNQI